jgi:deazaflavin-dependent oxidoreductase (nitroreductase family)
MPPASTPAQGPGNGAAASRPREGEAPRPARRYRPGRGRHAENMIMSALTRAGLVPRSCLLTTRGRTTGRPGTNPVVAVVHGGRRWLVAPYGPASWVHNARAAGRVSPTRRRGARDYTLREASAEEAGPVLEQYVRIAPSARLLPGQEGLPGRRLRRRGGPPPGVRTHTGRRGSPARPPWPLTGNHRPPRH